MAADTYGSTYFLLPMLVFADAHLHTRRQKEVCMARLANLRPTRAGIVFIGITIVLAVIVFAAIWTVRYRGEQVRQQEAAKIAEQNLEQQSDTPIIAQETAPSDEGEQGSSNSSESSQSQSSSNPAPSSSTLPTTGPEDLPLFIGVIGLSLAGAYYVSSRRTLNRL
jgi:hypothetical protein